MIYAGNDLVAFSELKYFNRPGYKEKAFTSDERQNASAFPDVAEYYGILWSCKESAYKVHLKSGSRKAFASGMYNVTLNNKKGDILSGSICYDGISFYSESRIERGAYIHTICSNIPEGLEKISHEVKQIDHSGYDLQNNEAISLLKNHLCSKYNIQSSEIDLHYDHLKKYPVVYFDSGNMHLDVSLSHDGNYVAYAFIVIDKDIK